MWRVECARSVPRALIQVRVSPLALVELADLGAEGGLPPGPPPPGALRAAAYGGPAAPGGVPELDLEPQVQTVQAQVNARFVMTAPEL